MFDSLTRSLAHPELIQKSEERRQRVVIPFEFERRLAERRGDPVERAKWYERMVAFLKKYPTWKIK